MISEQNKDQVFFADVLASDKKTRDTYQRIVDILDANNVSHGLLEGVADYWCRDYMPIQLGHDDFLQFRYHPDYLKKKRRYETSPAIVSEITQAVTNCLPQKADIIADGGNFTVCTTKNGNEVLVMTEKIFMENHPVSKEVIIKTIESKCGCDILFLPWDKEDECGHTDGIVHNIGDGRVLVNLAVYPTAIAKEMRKRLETMFEVVDLKLGSYHNDSWAYVNMLQTRNIIIVPGLGLDTDHEALEQIKSVHPEYDGRIFMVNLQKIVKKWGGALNCLSWTVSTQ